MDKILLRLQNRMRESHFEYADLRYVALERIRIQTQDGVLDEFKETRSLGVGFRVLCDGTFGFSSTRDLSEKSLLHHLDQAYRMAKCFARIRHAEVKLVDPKPVKYVWTMPIRKDPWKMETAELIWPHVESERKLIGHSWIQSASGTLDFTRKQSIFVSSEGSWIEQAIYRTGGWISAESLLGSKSSSGNYRERIRRSWPGPTGLYRSQGYEAIEEFKFGRETARIASELEDLRRSPEMPQGTYDLILKGSILALQLHETFGHASESDRVYGYEDNFGGRTFLNPGLVGGMPVASPHVSITSDPRPAHSVGVGCIAYDDEGVPARRVDVVCEGVFRGYLSSRETAYFLNQKQSSANMLAENGFHYPLIRMTNLNLLPGTGSLNEMIRETADGVLLDTELSWSIDELRLDFQIGAEMGYRIRGGKIVGLVQFPVYHSNTLDFWRSCDKVAGPREWRYWGFADCGKGGPYQEAFTGHGVSPARFCNVRFGRD